MVENSMNSVEAKGVEMKLVKPIKRVLDEETPHVIAFRAIEIQRRTPRCFVALGKVGREISQIISLWSEMVVNHIQNGCQSFFMAGIHQVFELTGAAIGILHGEGKGAIVSPISHAGKLRHRHELNGGDSQGLQLWKVRNDGFKGSFGCEGPDVELIDDVIL